MASGEGENISVPSVFSNPNTFSNSTTDGTLGSKKRKLSSIVWNDFDKVLKDGHDYANCKHCKEKLKVNSKNETKHLHTHIERCIKRRIVDIRQ